MAVLALAPLALVVAAAVRMLRGHWVPITAADEPLDFLTLTVAGIPLEEIEVAA